MSKHTEGPWEVDFYDHHSFSSPANKDDYFMRVEYTTASDNENNANGYLIAAAPELLAALKEAHYYLQLNHTDDCKCSACTKTRNAIAKAEGGGQ